MKTTSPLRQRVRAQFEAGEKKVGKGLRKGVRDGSVRADVNVRLAVSDISTALFGIAYRWLALPEGSDFARELTSVRIRIIEDYGTSSPR